ncbi:hypothetical protein T4B_7843 [Trichinella pseudospiralis]|uniref:Uncharacterized protein n=1 Tax=Trichinella pseudospiralis TaxID=6337 RepID=A0A0V1IMW8_TRIPS|nr:hypothetical protein T4A_8001 [Trichinella pseudospiralis]KRZ24155.1 hypothetical protein T4B_7843 [Trichinella pseudospiralis]
MSVAFGINKLLYNFNYSRADALSLIIFCNLNFIAIKCSTTAFHVKAKMAKADNISGFVCDNNVTTSLKALLMFSRLLLPPVLFDGDTRFNLFHLNGKQKISNYEDPFYHYQILNPVHFDLDSV